MALSLRATTYIENANNLLKSPVLPKIAELRVWQTTLIEELVELRTKGARCGYTAEETKQDILLSGGIQKICETLLRIKRVKP